MGGSPMCAVRRTKPRAGRPCHERNEAMSQIHRNCEGVARRDFIKLGIGAFAGLGFTDILRQRAAAAIVARALGKPSPSDVRCILIWLDGGPSHYESFDPKPDAPREIRGE